MADIVNMSEQEVFGNGVHALFGRRQIWCTTDELTEDNIVAEVNSALSIHIQNLLEMEYLYWYRRGLQPILNRKKEISIMRYIGVSDCRMQEGSMRCDVNISVGEGQKVVCFASKDMGKTTILKVLSSIPREFFHASESFSAIRTVSLSVCIRRLHDIGKSGWWYLLSFVPIIGWLAMIYFCVLDSQAGVNEYGPNPKS